MFNYISLAHPSMALGELLGEASGKVTSLKVLGDGKVEVAGQGAGKLLGAEISDIVTFWSIMRPNGTAYSEGKEMSMSADGMAEWKGSAVGRMTGPGAWKYSFGGAYSNATGKLSHLLDFYTVGEYEADAAGNYHWKLWEWKL